MDGLDFEDMLKKMVDAGDNNESIKESENENESNMEEVAVKGMLGILENGSLIRLSEASQKRANTLLDKLFDALSEYKDSGRSGSDCAKAMRAIRNAAKELKILDVFITSSGLTTLKKLTEPEADLKDTLELIIKMCLNH